MSQHLQKIFDGAISSLRDEVLPAIKDEVDRGQLVAVMTILSELRLKTDWSRDWLLQQVETQAATFSDIENMLDRASADWLRPPFRSVDNTFSGTELEALRDEGDRYLCLLQDQIADRSSNPNVPVWALRKAILNHIKLDYEIEAKRTPAVSLGRLQHDAEEPR